MADIEIENLTKCYGIESREVRVIDQLSVRFPQNGSIAILGPSGVGKSTLLHLLGGLIAPSSGSISVDGERIEELSDEDLASFRARRLGFVFQFHHLLPEFDAVENVAMPLLIQGVDRRPACEEAIDLLERVGLGERLKHRPAELSGGEQQRVAVARAVINKPSIVLADEPTGNLDLRSAQGVWKLLLELCRDESQTLVVVTHNRQMAAELDYVYEMSSEGELLEKSKQDL